MTETQPRPSGAPKRRHEAERAYTVREAAEIKSVSQYTIRRAIHASDITYLEAKNIGSSRHPKYRIAASALDDWFQRLPDA